MMESLRLFLVRLTQFGLAVSKIGHKHLHFFTRWNAL